MNQFGWWSYNPGKSRRIWYALLSSFFHHLRIFTQHHLNLQLQVTCDNDGLVRQVNKQTAYSYAYPNTTLLPDWDVIESIVDTIRDFQTPPTISWIKGNQDSKKAYEELTLEAQLNCDVDS